MYIEGEDASTLFCFYKWSWVHVHKTLKVIWTMLVLSYGWVMIIAYQRGTPSPWLDEWSRYSHPLLTDPSHSSWSSLKWPLQTNGPSSLVVIAVIVLYSLQNHDGSDLSELCTNYICMETSELPHTFYISSAFSQTNELQVFFRFVGKLTVQLKLLMSFFINLRRSRCNENPTYSPKEQRS